MTFDVRFNEQAQALNAKFGDVVVINEATVSVTKTEDGVLLTVTDPSGTQSVKISNGKDGVNGKDGLDGRDGENGVSCTHEWNGTTLTVTSASGTSSVNLKGEKGDSPIVEVEKWTFELTDGTIITKDVAIG